MLFNLLRHPTFRFLLLAWLFLVIQQRAFVSIAGASETSGYYRVEQRNGIWWFRTPEGNPFYSMGVDVVDMGVARESYDSKSPQYAAFRYQPTPEAWAAATLTRLRSWNFNTLGGWSDPLVTHGGMPYTVVLNLGTKKVPWDDIFAADLARKFDEAARRQIAPLANDRNLLGYFSDNELGWWDDTLFTHYLKQPASNASRQVLMRLLRNHYHNDFGRLLEDFDAVSANSFDDLEHHASLTLKRGGHGIDIVDEFMFLIADRYYKLAHDAIRRYDPHHLILGDRYPGYAPLAVARAAIPYVDVISTNYAADWTDGGISDFYLRSLHEATGKPILITEFYMSATENRSGNPNSSASFPVVATQRERAHGFRNNARAMAGLPFVVGTHWFQYYDEPTKGRSDGENYNFGLVDINDRPYEELTQAARTLSTSALHKRANRSRRPATEVVAVPAADTNAERGLLYWNKARSFVASTTSDPEDWKFADLHNCWNSQYLFLTVYAADFFEPLLYPGGRIPESERMTLSVASKDSSPLLIHFGPKDAASIEGFSVWLREWESPTRKTVMLKLPASMFGRKVLRAGDSLDLSATLTSHSRAERMDWRKVLRLTR